jgi:hypothetical protein
MATAINYCCNETKPRNFLKVLLQNTFKKFLGLSLRRLTPELFKLKLC